MAILPKVAHGSATLGEGVRLIRPIGDFIQIVRQLCRFGDFRGFSGVSAGLKPVRVHDLAPRQPLGLPLFEGRTGRQRLNWVHPALQTGAIAVLAGESGPNRGQNQLESRRC